MQRMQTMPHLRRRPPHSGFLHCPVCATNLLSLPFELIQEITSHLDTADTWLLRLTGRSLFRAILAPPNPRHLNDPHEFFKFVRDIIPKNLDYCGQRVQYHHIPINGAFVYRGTKERRNTFCHRYVESSQSERAKRRAGEFICLNCHFIRSSHHCKSCDRCRECGECYLTLQEMGDGNYRTRSPSRCNECCINRPRCWQCDRARLVHRGCKGCGVCESCAGVLFQFGRTKCSGCGGGEVRQVPSMRRVTVESGPGYELYYYGGQSREDGEGRRIGIGR